MKRAITLIAAIILLVGCNNGMTEKETRLKQTIEALTLRYPGITLQDIYKSFFQNHFGVAHMLADSATVRKYIAAEVANAQEMDSAYYEPCGYDQTNFFRVNLSAIRDGRISVEELADAFMASHPYSRTEMDDEWMKEWETVKEFVCREFPHLPNLAEDTARIGESLRNGKYVMHHSEAYSQRHHPHYRIVYKDIFRERILPKLEK